METCKIFIDTINDLFARNLLTFPFLCGISVHFEYYGLAAFILVYTLQEIVRAAVLALYSIVRGKE